MCKAVYVCVRVCAKDNKHTDNRKDVKNNE